MKNFVSSTYLVLIVALIVFKIEFLESLKTGKLVTHQKKDLAYFNLLKHLIFLKQSRFELYSRYRTN